MDFEKLTVKKELQGIEVQFDEPLANYTNTCTGGPADILALPASIQEVKRVIDWTNQKNVPLTVIGNASNLIVKNGGIRGMVMILTKLDRIKLFFIRNSRQCRWGGFYERRRIRGRNFTGC